MRWRLRNKDEEIEVRLTKVDGPEFHFEVGDEKLILTNPKNYPFSIKTDETSLAIESWDARRWRAVEGSWTYQVESIGFGRDSSGSEKQIQSQMPGRVLKVLVNEGDEVKEDQTLLVIEAMKMENEIRASGDGVIEKVFVQDGESIESGADLIRFK